MPESPDSVRIAARRKPRWGWGRRIAALLVALAVYRLVFWFPLRNVNEKKLKADLQSWAGALLCTDLKIGRLDSDLSVLGTVSLETDEISVEQPNPTFDGNFVTAGRVSASCPLWGLWGFRVKPEVLVEGAKFRLAWEISGESNLDGLCDPVGHEAAASACPLAEVNARTLSVTFQHCGLEAARADRERKFSCSFDGDAWYDTRKEKFWGNLNAAGIALSEDGKSLAAADATLKIRNFDYRREEEGKPPRLTAFETEFSNLPLRGLLPLLPGAPELPWEARASGRGELRRGVLTLYGAVGGLSVPALGLGEKLKFETTCGFSFPNESGKGEVRLLVEGETGPALRAVASRDGSGIAALELRCEKLDVACMPPFFCGLPEYLVQSAKKIPQITVEAKEAAFALPGQFLLCPKGSGALSVSLLRAQDEDGGQSVTAKLLLQKAVLPAEGAGTLLTELTGIPVFVGEVERLARESTKEKMPEQPQAFPLGGVRFLTLEINYTVDAAGHVQLTFAGSSPELGSVAGGGVLTLRPDGYAGELKISLKNVPPRLFELNRELSLDVREAINRKAGSAEGLGLDVAFAGGKAAVRRRYVEDIFMQWSAIQAAKK